MGDFYGCKVLWVEGSSFVISPSKSFLVLADNPFGKLDLFWPKEVSSNRHLVMPLKSDSPSRYEVLRMHSKQWVRMLLLNDPEVL